jgi:predicted ATP-grasp superfamily ATP-dependent carboligase
VTHTSNSFSIDSMDKSTPVLILGGRENALSLARSYGRLGITVRICGSKSCWGIYSRFCSKAYRIPDDRNSDAFWSTLLLEEQHPELENSLLIAGNDDAILFVANNRPQLEQNYILPPGNAELELKLLDKEATLELARQVGVPAPNHWRISCLEDLDRIRDEIAFPVILKPLLSHRFFNVFKKKLFAIENSFDELVEKAQLAWSHGLEVMVVELIPGPDSALSSYYTFTDSTGACLFNMTKSVVRRYPVNYGGTCLHLMDWLPETEEMGKRFFRGIGFTGFASIEFKRDPRDNQLKVIEVNGRFTAPQELLTQAGARIDLVYYCACTDQSVPDTSGHNTQLKMWKSPQDFLAFLQLRRSGQITLWQWLKSVYPFNHVSCLNQLSDPIPTFGAYLSKVPPGWLFWKRSKG